jgi:hypothetical protein
MKTRAFTVVAVAAWMAGLFALDSITGDGNLQGLLAVAWTVVLGTVVGRWWLLAVPWLTACGLLAYGELTACHCTSVEDETPFFGLVLIGAGEAYVADMAILAGLALRWLLRRAWRLTIEPLRARRRAAGRR